ncbi:MAG TPA: DedA family protein [Bacteroidota bacterium]|nr:DedA family protein [Bacteroidota bacterium]
MSAFAPHVESFVHTLASLNPFLIYCSLFAISYIENIFPPSPSDVVVVFGGYLCGLGTITLSTALIVTTLGSATGFLTMYMVGDWFGAAVVERKRFRFLPLENIHKVEEWFRKYGYWIIVANRFLSGTRAIVSFFAGMSKLKIVQTTLLCAVSALIWNWLMLYSGSFLGSNWNSITVYLSSYGEIITGVIIFSLVVWGVRWLYLRGKTHE